MIAASVLLEAGIILDLVVPPAALLLSFAVALADRVVFEQAEQRRIREAMGRYLSPSVSRWVLADPRRLRLGGELREMTVLFSDLRNFTTHAHALAPETLVGLLNDHMTEMTAIVFRHDGVLAHYAGDGLEAFWNAPMTQPDHARRACAAALEMIAALGAPPARVRGARLGGARHGRRDQHRQHDRREPGIPRPPRLHGRRRPGQRGVPDRRPEQGVRGARRDRRGHPAGGGRRLRVPLPRPGGREGTRRAPPGLRAPRARRQHPSGAARGARALRPRRHAVPESPLGRGRRSSSRTSRPRRPTTAPSRSTAGGPASFSTSRRRRDWDGVWVAKEK